MNRRTVAATFFAATLPIAALAQSLKPVNSTRESPNLFVLAGQSNADGRGDASLLDTSPTDEDVPLWFVAYSWPASNMNRWITLQPQEGIYTSGHFGPELTFARSAIARGDHPAIFKFTDGGTSLQQHWLAPGQGGLYDAMLTSLSSAMSASNGSMHVAALIWIQGEADAISHSAADEYEGRLRTIIEDFRRVAGVPRLPVILGVVESCHAGDATADIAAIIAAQERLAATMAGVSRVSSRGLTRADSCHLDTYGVEAYGQLIYLEYERLAESSKRGRAVKR